MPTNNPRVNVTLSPSTDALVRRLATYQRVSKSQVLRELLEAAEPALQRAATLMEAAAGAHGAVVGNMRSQLDAVMSKAEQTLATLLEGQDALAADLVAQAEEVRGRRPALAHAQHGPGQDSGRRRSAVQNPPSSNRGVKSPGKGKARATAGGRK